MLGFCLATSMFWTVFGVSAKSTMDELMKVMLAAKVHIQQDQVMSAQDVLTAKNNGN